MCKSNNVLICKFSYSLIVRYKEEYRRFLQLDSTKKMISKYKNVMNYLTDHSGKLINNTEAVAHMYNLLKEEVSNYFDNKKLI